MFLMKRDVIPTYVLIMAMKLRKIDQMHRRVAGGSQFSRNHQNYGSPQVMRRHF